MIPKIPSREKPLPNALCLRGRHVRSIEKGGNSFKQLLDEAFFISRVINIEDRVISQKRGWRVIILSETLIIFL